MSPVSIPVEATRLSRSESSRLRRTVPIEAPVSIEINGLGYAVMMATPGDLLDFGAGFLICEGVIGSLAELVDAEAIELEHGWLLRLTVDPDKAAPFAERVRHRMVESGCGLCGVENLEQAIRPLPQVGAPGNVSTEAVFAALKSLANYQPLNAASGAAHAAALCSSNGTIWLSREDVGRHCALDKLVGGAARGQIRVAAGFVLLSSRCSYELVEKVARAGVPMLVTISAPTSLAVERAVQAGLTLVTLARPDSILVMNDPHGRFGGALSEQIGGE